MTKQTTLWIVGIATLVIVVIIGLVVIVTQEPNHGFKDAAATLTFITGAAVAIERIIEVMWTIFGGVWGTYWPLNAISKQVKSMVEDLDSALKPFHETSLRHLLQDDANLTDALFAHPLIRALGSKGFAAGLASGKGYLLKRLRTFLLLIALVLAACGAPREEPAVEIPSFPWPPPHASATIVVPMSALLTSDEVEQGSLVLGDVDRHLSEALEAAGYDEKSYYAVADGFALVTRLEQIAPDGTAKEGTARWSVEIAPPDDFSLSAYIRALFTAPRGFYRVIVFIISPHPFTQTDERVSQEETLDWLRQGANRLPQNIAAVAYTEAYVTTALIYEFEKPGRGADAVLKIEGIPTARQHLERANLWSSLR